MSSFLKSLPLALAFLFALYVVSAGEVQVRASKAEVKPSYSLQQTQLSLHEPLVITFRINNESTEIVSLDLGQDRKGGFLFTVTSPDGTTLRVPQYSHEGISQYG